MPEELKKRLIGAFILIILFTIFVPVLISGDNINKDQKLLEQIERQHAYRELNASGDAVRDAEPEPSITDEPLVAERLEQNSRKSSSAVQDKNDLDNVRIVDDHRNTQTNTSGQQENKSQNPGFRPSDSKNSQQNIKTADNRVNQQNTRPAQNTKPAQNAKPAAAHTPVQPKNTVTVINQDSHKKIEVPIKPAKPDPNYIYDGGRKVESKPIVTKNPITGNLDRYELSAGAYSTSTAAKNLETKIKKYCGGVTKIVPVMKPNTRERMFRVICGNSTNVAELQRIQAQLKPYVNAQLQRAR